MEPCVQVTCVGGGKRWKGHCRQKLVLPLSAFDDPMDLAEACAENDWVALTWDDEAPEGEEIEDGDGNVSVVPAGTPLPIIEFACTKHGVPVVQAYLDSLTDEDDEDSEGEAA
jgi:hypothetical protein